MPMVSDRKFTGRATPSIRPRIPEAAQEGEEDYFHVEGQRDGTFTDIARKAAPGGHFQTFVT